MKPKTIVYIAIAVVVLGVLFSWNSIFPSKPPVVITDPSGLPGMQIGDAPWQPELAHLAERLRAIGLPTLSSEGAAMHIHQHIDMFIHGKPIAVPANIGIDQAANFISDIHVHDGSGVIHIESPTIQDFTLGQFFDIWGVRFTQQSIGGYTAGASDTLKVFVNGQPFTGDPRTLVLAAHQEIVVTYGTAQELPAPIPASYTFGPGL